MRKELFKDGKAWFCDHATDTQFYYLQRHEVEFHCIFVREDDVCFLVFRTTRSGERLSMDFPFASLAEAKDCAEEIVGERKYVLG